MIYTIPYILLICFLSLMALLYDDTEDIKLKSQFMWAAIIIFFVFFGFRGFILSDWTTYYPYFYDCDLNDILEWYPGSEDHWEPGFTLLCLICKSILREYFFLQIVCSIIVTGLLLRFFRLRVDNIALALMIYIVFEGLVISTNLMRNSIAIVIFLNAIPYIEQRKFLPYLSLILLAMTFHFSAIIYLPLYIFFHIRFNKWIYLSIIICCNVIYLGHISVFLPIASLLGIDDYFAMRIKAYTEVFNTSTGLSIGYLERLLTSMLVFLYYNKLNEVRKNNAVFINGLIAYFVMFFFFSEFQVLSKRFANLFAYGYWIIWIDLIKCFAIANNRRLFKAFIFIYCVMRMAGSTYLPDFAYDNILFGATSYQERLRIHDKTFEEPI